MVDVPVADTTGFSPNYQGRQRRLALDQRCGLHRAEHLADPVAQQHPGSEASLLEQLFGEPLVGDRAA